jgi:putative membrane protein
MLYLKALHIIFIVTWFAGLFYLVRLFIYFQEAEKKDPVIRDALQDQFKVMISRLWYGITWPSAILTLVLGLSLLHNFFPLGHHPWLITKLLFVGLLYLYHFLCGRMVRQIKLNNFHWTSTKLRLWNEVATIFLVAIIFLVELQSIMGLVEGVVGLILFSGALMLAIFLYRKYRLLKR